MPKPLWADNVAPASPLPVRITSPCPGVGIGTPWGKKPNDRTYWQARGHHTGDDYPGGQGAPVVAVLGGRVDHLEDGVLGHVLLLYADDGFTYWYCHLFARTARDGTRVNAGDQLGRVGQTGTGARGPHLHFEKRSGHTRSWAGKDLLPRW